MNHRYLAFARQAADLLWARQKAMLAGNPAGTPCLVVSTQPAAAWTSIALRADGHYDLYPVAARLLETEPARLDLGAWSWMERLSELTGEPVWRERVDAMAREFAVYGFDPRSGLAYFGDQAQFDVVRLGPVSTTFGVPMFKPAGGLPLEPLWRGAGAPMDRMFRAAYLAFVTRPDDFSYNRLSYYGHDDRAGRPFQAFDPAHCAFAYTGALLIHWWVFHWRKTRSDQSLAWARAMADKWRSVQHPDTGLVPHWLGSDDPKDTVQRPRPYANAMDILTAVLYLEIARLLRDETDASAGVLRDQLQELGTRLAVGMARYGYDENERIFPSWICLADGSVDRETIYYAFPTQAQKDEAVRRDPRLAVASVHGGNGPLTGGPYLRAAELTGEKLVVERARLIASHVLERAVTLGEAPSEKGPWTYDTRAGFVSALLSLARATGEARYRDHAAALLDRELDVLAKAPGDSGREWWRFPARNALLNALLELTGETQ